MSSGFKQMLLLKMLVKQDIIAEAKKQTPDSRGR